MNQLTSRIMLAAMVCGCFMLASGTARSFWEPGTAEEIMGDPEAAYTRTGGMMPTDCWGCPARSEEPYVGTGLSVGDQTAAPAEESKRIEGSFTDPETPLLQEPYGGASYPEPTEGPAYR